MTTEDLQSRLEILYNKFTLGFDNARQITLLGLICREEYPS
jgi:hypothetical protein